MKYLRIFKLKQICIVLLLLLIMYGFYNGINIQYSRTPIDPEVINSPISSKYLINTTNCKIPQTEAFNKDIIPFYEKEKYEMCSGLELLSYVEKRNGRSFLKIRTDLLPRYSFFNIYCCYSNISRVLSNFKPDSLIRYSKCLDFEGEVELFNMFIKVECRNIYKTVYSNVHAMNIEQNSSANSSLDKYSVLLLGIDSISQTAFKRDFPKTRQYIKEHGFVELKGYNKIGENTFPNIMALLTGKTLSQLNKSCKYKHNKLDDCGFIWNDFKQNQYKTGYGEDQCAISTFHFEKQGFKVQPTDFYLRPYMLAAEELGTKKRYGMNYCAGPETSGERILNAAKDFAITYKDTPNFSLFWMNSFSHDNINLPTSFDEVMWKYFQDDDFKIAVKNSFVVFFSDHGFRFGDFRLTYSGWLEERLPFIFISVPDSFKNKFKEKYQNFLTNSENRLVTPYDLFLTMQDLIKMGNENFVPKQALGCPLCHSLFKEISFNRKCEDAGISKQWCTCAGHEYISTKNPDVLSAGHYIVREINSFVKNYTKTNKDYKTDIRGNCYSFSLKRVVSAGRSKPYLNEDGKVVNFYLLIIETWPFAAFEATVEKNADSSGSFSLLEQISRIDRYDEHSKCVKHTALKKYCYCDTSSLEKVRLPSAICYIINC